MKGQRPPFLNNAKEKLFGGEIARSKHAQGGCTILVLVGPVARPVQLFLLQLTMDCSGAITAGSWNQLESKGQTPERLKICSNRTHTAESAVYVFGFEVSTSHPRKRSEVPEPPKHAPGTGRKVCA